MCLFRVPDVRLQGFLSLQNELMDFDLLSDMGVPQVKESVQLQRRRGALFRMRCASGGFFGFPGGDFFGLFHVLLTERTFLYPFSHHLVPTAFSATAFREVFDSYGQETQIRRFNQI